MTTTPANIHAALVAAHGELTNPTKSKAADFGYGKPYKYADLASVLALVRPILAKHGLAVSQSLSHNEGRMCVTTTLHHISGETLTFGTIEGPGVGKWQDLGSAITYARRYALTAALGIAGDEDDDGAHAQQAVESGPRKPKPKAIPEPPKPVATEEQTTEWLAAIMRAETFIDLKRVSDEIAAHHLDDQIGTELRSAWTARRAEVTA